jgi:hypothetical protein
MRVRQDGRAWFRLAKIGRRLRMRRRATFSRYRRESRIMTKWQFEHEFDDDSELGPPSPLARRFRGKMPVGSEAKAKAAAKETWRSRQATKRVARVTSGIRNRRNKRID